MENLSEVGECCNVRTDSKEKRERERERNGSVVGALTLDAINLTNGGHDPVTDRHSLHHTQGSE